MKGFVLSIIVTAMCGSIRAQSIATCELAAWVADRDSGVNIRAKAGVKAKVVSVLPPDRGGTLLFINGSKDDWLKISSAVNSRKAHVFSGIGWVHASLLFVRTRSDDGDLVLYYRTPRLETEALGSLRPDLEVTVVGCSGDWIKVLIPKRGTEGIPAWIPQDSFCGSPWEDCV